MIGQLPSPAYLNSFIVLAFVVHLISPIKRIIFPPFTYLGLILILIGVISNVWAVRTMKFAKTTIEYGGVPVKLVKDGPFNISRNPIYLSGVVISLGIAILLGSLVTFVFPIGLWLILDKLYIPSEEIQLERLFGKQFMIYKKRVRRWI